MNLTPAQRAALAHWALSDADRARVTRPPRRDVLVRLDDMGLVTLHWGLTHAGSTSRSREITVITSVALTAKGRDALAAGGAR